MHALKLTWLKKKDKKCVCVGGGGGKGRGAFSQLIIRETKNTLIDLDCPQFCQQKQGQKPVLLATKSSMA